MILDQISVNEIIVAFMSIAGVIMMIKQLSEKFGQNGKRLDNKGRLRLVKSKANINGKEYVVETPFELSRFQRYVNKVFNVIRGNYTYLGGHNDECS